MQPDELFALYRHKVRPIARNLCLHYKISGAMSFQDEAESEAYKALWKCALKFNPRKQIFQNHQHRVANEDANLAYFLGMEVDESSVPDPYEHFWVWSLPYMRGAVIDFFRSQRLITKATKGAPPVHTMLIYDRLLSMNRPLSEITTGGSMYETLGDTLQSNETTDCNDDRTDNTRAIAALKQKAHLTASEEKVLGLCYDEQGYNKTEVAHLLRMSLAWVQKTEDSALNKLRLVANHH